MSSTTHERKVESKSKAAQAIQSRRREHPSTDEVDRILDKVARSGIGSLTEKEKKTLNEASKNQRNAS